MVRVAVWLFACALAVVWVSIPCSVARGQESRGVAGEAGPVVDLSVDPMPDWRDPELERRQALIEAELRASRLAHWAGEYRHGDGLGVNISVSIAPKSGFTYSWTGCLGLYERNYGRIDVRADRIVLEPLLPRPEVEEMGGFLPRSFFPVRWGKRHYLIGDDQFEQFANFVNAGELPCSGYCSGFLVRKEDEKEPALGLPELPHAYRHLLLDEPIRARVIRVVDSARNIVEIDAGRRQGVWTGMDFHSHSTGTYDVFSVTDVRERTSIAKLRDYGSDCDPPRVGLPLSTRWREATSLR